MTRSSKKFKKEYPSKEKARKILRDGKVHGVPLTEKQKRFFRWIAGGRKAEKGVKNTKKVIITHNPDDPRLKAYKDSLFAYRTGEEDYAFGKSIYDKVRAPYNVKFRENYDIVQDSTYEAEPFLGMKPIESYSEHLVPKPRSWYQRNFGETPDPAYVDEEGKRWQPHGAIWHRFKEPVQPIVYKPKSEVKESKKITQPKRDTISKLSPREQAYKDSLMLYNRNPDFINMFDRRHLESSKNWDVFNNDSASFDAASYRYSGASWDANNTSANESWNKWAEAETANLDRFRDEYNKAFALARKTRIMPSVVTPARSYSQSAHEAYPSWKDSSLTLFKKPVYDPTPMRGMQSLPVTDVSAKQQRNIQPVPNGFTTDMPYRSGVKVFHSQQGKPMWFINRTGERRPYVSSPEINSVLTKDFVYPKLQDGGKNEKKELMNNIAQNNQTNGKQKVFKKSTNRA